jgi:hypothetical protein
MERGKRKQIKQRTNGRAAGTMCGVVVYLMKSPLHTSQKVIELKQEGGRMINERGK